MTDKVLIIEDSTEIRENTAELLALAGYKVFTANNGKDGLESVKSTKPDLILCDILMPELDGYGVLKAIENLPDMIGTPFIFITAKSDRSDFRKAMEFGADDYLTKPFEGEELLNIVSSRLKKHEMLKKKLNKTFEDSSQTNPITTSFLNMDVLSENRTIKKIKKKDYIYKQGDITKFLYFIVNGKVKTVKINELDKEYITEIHKKGDFFGHLALLNECTYKDSAIALENTEIALVPKEDFIQLMNANQNISLKLIKFISKDLEQAEEKLMKLAYNSARKRVAEALIFIHKKYLHDRTLECPFPANRETISSIAGISPESVSRNLSDLKEEGLIDSSNGMVRILKLKNLEDLKN